MKSRLRLTLIIAALAVIVAVGAGATVSYLITNAPPIENEFEPIAVSCLVVEGGGDGSGTDVSVQNTGDISAYLRVTLIVNWVSEKNGNVYSVMPKKDVDYSFGESSSGWSLGSDGFYYCLMPVSAGALSEVLVSQLTEITDAPDGYKLSLKAYAQAVQAEPDAAVKALWGLDVGTDGSLLVR